MKKNLNSPVRLTALTALMALPALLLAAPTAWAQPAPGQPAPPRIERLALVPISGTNVHPGYLDAARDILKDHLLQTGRFSIVSLAGEPGAPEIAPEQAVAQAREAGADLVAITHLARLGGTGRVRLSAYRVATGALFHTDGIGIAGGPDDLDPALKRLAVGLATGKPAAQNGEIDSVTQRQSDPMMKETATKIFGVRIGALLPFNRPGNQDTIAMPGIGLFWLYDARSFLGELSLDLHTGEGATSFDIGIGGYHPLSKENFTPYVGGQVAYSITDNSYNGIRLQPAFGFLFGRLSTIQFRGEIGYFMNTFGQRTYDVNGLLSDKSYAHGPQFSVGLGF